MINFLSMSDLVLGANDRKLLVCKSTRKCSVNMNDDRKAFGSCFQNRMHVCAHYSIVNNFVHEILSVPSVSSK